MACRGKCSQVQALAASLAMCCSLLGPCRIAGLQPWLVADTARCMYPTCGARHSAGQQRVHLADGRPELHRHPGRNAATFPVLSAGGGRVADSTCACSHHVGRSRLAVDVPQEGRRGRLHLCMRCPFMHARSRRLAAAVEHSSSPRRQPHQLSSQLQDLR